jgi:hypothetical protein
MQPYSRAAICYAFKGNSRCPMDLGEIACADEISSKLLLAQQPHGRLERPQRSKAQTFQKSACCGPESRHQFHRVWNHFGSRFASSVMLKARQSKLNFAVLRIELRCAEKGVRQLPELVAELVRLEVDVITAFGDLAPKVAQQATGTIPIVAICDDIVGAGVVASLSHPGANITGFTLLAPELSAKRLELLKEFVPGNSRVAVLWDPTTGKAQVKESENAARSLNLNLQILEVRNRDAIPDAFAAARDGQAGALIVFASRLLASLNREIITLAAEYRLPAIYQCAKQ